MVGSRPVRDLRQALAFVDETAKDLDPSSRYVKDLKKLIAESKDADELNRKLTEQSRGLRHTGSDVFAKMTLEQKLLANLITPETQLFRFSEGELEAIDRELLPKVSGRIARVLIVPCSH